MFKNLMFFRLALPAGTAATELAAALEADQFEPCTPSQADSSGWVPPRGAGGALVESIDGQWIAKFFTEKKTVPASAIQKRVDEMAEQIEGMTGRTPGERERRDMKADAILELLPRAFPRQSAALVWIDPDDDLLAVEAAGVAKTDDVISSLMALLPEGATVRLLQTKTQPQSAMTAWLQDAEMVPRGFALGRHCVLEAAGEAPARVRFDNHMVDDDVLMHLRGGHLPVAMALAFNDSMTFTLTDALVVKKIEFDAVGKIDDADRFDTDVVLATAATRSMLDSLVWALGGEEIPAPIQ